VLVACPAIVLDKRRDNHQESQGAPLVHFDRRVVGGMTGIADAGLRQSREKTALPHLGAENRRRRKVELLFAALFALFFVGSLNFDFAVPLGVVNPSAAYYMKEVDPIYLDPPSWLRAVKWFAFAVGPLYLVTAYGFLRSKSWLPYVMLPLAGLVVSTTGIYMVADLTGEVPPSNLAVFYAFNVPYIVVHILAATWLVGRRRRAITPPVLTARHACEC
jgi:EXPERA (EXPanded EBP superfamily)